MTDMTNMFTHSVMHKNHNMMITIGNSYYDIDPHMAFKWACLHGDIIATQYIYNMFGKMLDSNKIRQYMDYTHMANNIEHIAVMNKLFPVSG
jgi:hypothetical protein